MSESDGCEMSRGFPDQALDTNKFIIEYIMLRLLFLHTEWKKGAKDTPK
jgi:hypothetical protein